MLCSLSNLNDNDLQEIHKLEKDIQLPLLAFSCNNTSIAHLSIENLKKIQDLEKKLGISLVAVGGEC